MHNNVCRSSAAIEIHSFNSQPVEVSTCRSNLNIRARNFLQTVLNPRTGLWIYCCVMWTDVPTRFQVRWVSTRWTVSQSMVLEVRSFPVLFLLSFRTLVPLLCQSLCCLKNFMIISICSFCRIPIFILTFNACIFHLFIHPACLSNTGPVLCRVLRCCMIIFRQAAATGVQLLMIIQQIPH